MWSRHLIKHALCAVRIHWKATTVQNAVRSFQSNNRFYATAPTTDIDMLFNLGKEKPKKSPQERRKRTPSAQDEANILDAINFNPQRGVTQTKRVRRASTRKRGSIREAEPSEEDILAAVQKKKEARAARKQAKAEAPTFDELTIHDTSLDLRYIKLPLGHPQIQSLMLLTRSRKFRSNKHLLMMEGIRLIEDALEAGLPLKYLFFSRHEKLEKVKDLLHSKCGEAMPKIFRVPQHDLTFWSVMTTCPGLIAIFEKFADMTAVWERARACSTETASNAANEEPQITVICDQIREPSNIGSVIRTCAALPCAQVILMKGCTNPWETKALRGGCGGQFRVPIRGPMDWDSLPSFLPRENRYSVFVASNKLEETIDGTRRKFKSEPYSAIPYKLCNHVVLIVGGETEGVSDDAIKFMANNKVENEGETNTPKGSCIHIPLSNGVESLNSNAAAAIMLFEIRKQMRGN